MTQMITTPTGDAATSLGEFAAWLATNPPAGFVGFYPSIHPSTWPADPGAWVASMQVSLDPDLFAAELPRIPWTRLPILPTDVDGGVLVASGWAWGMTVGVILYPKEVPALTAVITGLVTG